eukprot:5234426-Pyramimonas_sp.AAC.1
MKFKPTEQWASRPTKLGSACHVEPVAPHPVAIGPDEARRICRPSCTWGPIAEPIVALQVADAYELAIVLRDVNPAVGAIAPTPWAAPAVLK